MKRAVGVNIPSSSPLRRTLKAARASREEESKMKTGWRIIIKNLDILAVSDYNGIPRRQCLEDEDTVSGRTGLGGRQGPHLLLPRAGCLELQRHG